MKRRLLKFALWTALVGFVGFLGVASGIVPIPASAGHWGITRSFVQFAKSRSVATHSRLVPPLTFEEPWLVMKGAGHYESGCLPCHGSPRSEYLARIGRGMAPAPPYLPERIGQLKPEALFYVVKHGLKFTGMPAWPTQLRDDEVRAMVAFLLKLPELDDAGYQQLVYGETTPGGVVTAPRDPSGMQKAPRAIAETCARCHGEDGLGRSEAAFPKLAGQSRDYLFNALEAYAKDQRHSGIMQPIAVTLSPEEMGALADYYAALPLNREGQAGDPAAIARGERIAREGIAEQRVPSCMECHGPGPGRRNPAYPRLSGQFADYLVLQLQLFREGRRGGSAFGHLMNEVAPLLTHEQMRDVAEYFASQPDQQER